MMRNSPRGCSLVSDVRNERETIRHDVFDKTQFGPRPQVKTSGSGSWTGAKKKPAKDRTKHGLRWTRYPIFDETLYVMCDDEVLTAML